MAALGKHMAITESARGPFIALETRRRMALSFAGLLGSREEAMREVTRQLQLPGAMPRDWSSYTSLASLWNDREFLSMVNDPANNAPLPFDMTYP